MKTYELICINGRRECFDAENIKLAKNRASKIIKDFPKECGNILMRCEDEIVGYRELWQDGDNFFWRPWDKLV